MNGTHSARLRDRHDTESDIRARLQLDADLLSFNTKDADEADTHDERPFGCARTKVSKKQCETRNRRVSRASKRCALVGSHLFSKIPAKRNELDEDAMLECCLYAVSVF